MSATAAIAVLAHQGGWDEILLVAAPLSLFAGLLYLANRRANWMVEHRDDAPRSEPDDDEPSDG